MRLHYTGTAGLSWSIPYAAGVLALGWQVNPKLTPERMVALPRETAHVKDGAKIINPVAFILDGFDTPKLASAWLV